MSSPEKQPLKKVMSKLRTELEELQAESETEGVRFRVLEAEVELQVSLTDDRNGGFELSCLMFKGNAEKSVSREEVQTIRLKLHPENQVPPAPQPAPTDTGYSSPSGAVGGQVDVLIKSDEKPRG